MDVSGADQYYAREFVDVEKDNQIMTGSYDLVIS